MFFFSVIDAIQMRYDDDDDDDDDKQRKAVSILTIFIIVSAQYMSVTNRQMGRNCRSPGPSLGDMTLYHGPRAL